MITEEKMLKKTLVGLFSVLLVFIGYEISPIFANLMPKRLISEKVSTFDMMGQNMTVKVLRYDTFQFYKHFVSFNATCEINGIPFMNVSTEEYPYDKLVASRLSATSSIPSEWKYAWDGNITFVKYPGPPNTYIKYDHPDNYDTYRPGDVNINYTLQGHEKIHYHIPQYVIEDAKSTVELSMVLTILYGILPVLIGIPEGAISKIVAGVVAIVIIILEAIQAGILWFLENKLQTELGDGWSWFWGFGSWWVFKWWWQSFGAWRDWGWFFVVFNWNVFDHFPWGGGTLGRYYMCPY